MFFPEEIVQHIVSFSDANEIPRFYEFRRVSRLFRNVTRNVVSLRFQDAHWLVTDATLSHVLDHVGGLRAIDLSDCARISDAAISDLVQRNPMLEEIDIARCTLLTDSTLRELADGCPHLRVLRCDHCLSFSNEAVARLAAGCPRLESVCVNGCMKLGSPAANALLALPAMERLNMRLCWSLNEIDVTARLREIVLEGCTDLEPASLDALLSACPDLEVLNLCDCGKIEGAEYIPRLVASPCFSTLRTLDLRYLSVYDNDLTALCASRITRLVLHGCPLTARCFAVLGTIATLEELSMKLCWLELTGNDLAHLTACPLRYLDLTGNALRASTPGSPALAFPRLETLHVSCENTDMYVELARAAPALRLFKATPSPMSDIMCAPPSDDAPRAFALLCPRLQSLRLPAQRFTSAGFRALAALEEMKSLRLFECNALTAEDLPGLLRPGLTALDIRGARLTDACVALIAAACPKLRLLRLQAAVTDTVVDALARSPLRRTLEVLRLADAHATDGSVGRLVAACPRLRVLVLTGCMQLTDAVAAPLARCLRLERLDLSGCAGLTDNAITTLGDGCPSLRWLGLLELPNLTGRALNCFSERRLVQQIAVPESIPSLRRAMTALGRRIQHDRSRAW